MSASTRDSRDVGLIPWLGRSPEGGNGNPTSILAWKILGPEEPGKLQSIGLQRVDMTEVIKHVCTHTSLQIAPNS